MQNQNRLGYLRIALVLIGLIFIGALPFFLFYLKSPGWAWIPSQPKYEQMIYGIYATLGVFLILAARNPLEYRSLISFTIWSSIVHATIMFFQAIQDPAEHAHLLGDVPALYLVAIVLAVLMPKKENQIG